MSYFKPKHFYYDRTYKTISLIYDQQTHYLAIVINRPKCVVNDQNEPLYYDDRYIIPTMPKWFLDQQFVDLGPNFELTELAKELFDLEL